MKRYQFDYAWVLGLLGFVFLPSVTALADGSGGQVICLGRYALCSSALCQPIAGDKTKVRCDCEVPPEGLNIGNSTCLSRAQNLTSTFSLWDLTATKDKKAKLSLACTGDNAGTWAFCLDAPCTVVNGRASCTCKLMPRSDYYTFISSCPSSEADRREACGKIWSGANKAELMSGYSQLWSYYADFPDLVYCPR